VLVAVEDGHEHVALDAHGLQHRRNIDGLVLMPFRCDALRQRTAWVMQALPVVAEDKVRA
jgi:hypothetical protein